uniref:MADS-box protein AGL42-like n=1 Tax=Erigeron canadensis TaxID=72917 RepID=UPI001CB94E46|nr:MADS-box protein AGL42-like [Erigeron canadensis]
MGRAKIQMEFITDNKKRETTFKKRKLGVIKKASELSTLCDVFVLMIIFSDHQETPQIFPPDTEEFDRLIEFYIKTRASDLGKIKSYDLLQFLKDRKSKIEEELFKTKKKKLHAKYPTWFDSLNDAPEKKLREFAYVLGNKIDNVKVRIESLKKASYVQNLNQDYKNVLNFVNPITLMNPSMDYNKSGYGLYSYGGDQNQNNMFMQLQSSNPNLAMKTPMMSNQDFNNNYCDPIKAMMLIGYNNNNNNLGGFDCMELCRNDKNNLFMPSLNPNFVNRNSFMKMMSEDDRERYDDFNSFQNLLRAEGNGLARPDARYTQELVRDGVFNLM